MQAGVSIGGERGVDGLAGQAVTSSRVGRSRVGERLDRQCEMRSCSLGAQVHFDAGEAVGHQVYRLAAPTQRVQSSNYVSLLREARCL